VLAGVRCMLRAAPLRAQHSAWLGVGSAQCAGIHTPGALPLAAVQGFQVLSDMNAFIWFFLAPLPMYHRDRPLLYPRHWTPLHQTQSTAFAPGGTDVGMRGHSQLQPRHLLVAFVKRLATRRSAMRDWRTFACSFPTTRQHGPFQHER